MKKGFTLVELLAVIVIIALIAVIAVPMILGVINKARKGAMDDDARIILDTINREINVNPDFKPIDVTEDTIEDLLHIKADNYEDLVVTIVDGKPRVVVTGQGKFDDLTAYGTKDNLSVVNTDDYDVTPPVITLSGDNPMDVEQGGTYTEPGATATDAHDGNITGDIVITGTVDTNTVATYTITYTVSDANDNTATVTRTVHIVKVGNPPVLATGMIPVMYNGTAWVKADTTDANATYEWYNYPGKKWANAVTVDAINRDTYLNANVGTVISMADINAFWVWIPRYIYKISSGWNTSTTGTINILFSKGTDDTRDGTITLDTGTAAAASNNMWTNEPAFTFGIELTGIWAAKFKASGSTAAVSIKPNVASVRLIGTTKLNNFFTATRNMELDSRFGWGTTGTGIDTHLTKNVEWGAAAYLAQSTYGKNSELYTSASTTYLTGCSNGSTGTTVSGVCQYAYDTTEGQGSSTTGNIYGIYDMVGIQSETVAAYSNNTDYLTWGEQITLANIKYRDVYDKAFSGTPLSYYAPTSLKKGDAMYETSSSNGSSVTAWYGDAVSMGGSTNVWVLRGGVVGSTVGLTPGIFGFNGYSGAGSDTNIYSDKIGYRPVLAVQNGL